MINIMEELHMEAGQSLLQPDRIVAEVRDREQKKESTWMDGPDGGRAWFVALAACLINFIMAGLGRMSGILYVSFIEIFHVNRKNAMVPFGIRLATRNLLGPVVGIFGQQYGVRAVTITGGIIGTLSAASCYYASTIDYISVLWGFINGVGTALTTTLPQVVIGQHFRKYRSTAAGLAFSGGCVGSFLFPAFIEFTIDNYGLQGTFLIMSGIIMHVIPAALILKRPTWTDQSISKSKQQDSNPKRYSSPSGVNVIIVPTDNDDIIHQTVQMEKSSETTETLHKNSKSINNLPSSNNSSDIIVGVITPTLNDVIREVQTNGTSENAQTLDGNSINNNLSDSNKLIDSEILQTILAKLLEFSSDSKECCPDISYAQIIQLKEKCISKNTLNLSNYTSEEIACLIKIMKTLDSSPTVSTKNFVSFYLRNANPPQVVRDEDELRQLLKTLHDLLVESLKPNASNAISNEKLEINKGIHSFKNHIITAFKLYSNPMFLLICFCRAVHFMTFFPVLTTVVDFGMDKGLPHSYGKYIIAALSAGDLCGRLCLGWVTDRGYVSLPRYMLIIMILQAACTASLPFMYTKFTLVSMLVMFGMLQGSVFVRHPVLVSKYMRDQEQAIAMGCMNFFSGILGFGMPLYIGYFRDTLGSYDQMFYITACVGTCVGLMWVFEPRCVKYLEKRGLYSNVMESTYL